MGTWVNFKNGKGVAIQIDGIITRNANAGSDGGNMILVQGGNDIELGSGTGKGAVQGLGYLLHRQGNIKGARILRFQNVTDFSVHDFIMVDSPAFHFTMDSCSNGEVYNLAIRGGDQGGLDGVDIWGNNIWAHDVSSRYPF